MKLLVKMITAAGMAAALVSCSDKAAEKDFKYLMDEFADLKIIYIKICNTNIAYFFFFLK